jgi:cell division protein FtsX
MATREFSAGSYTGNSSTDPATGQRIMTSFPYQSFQRMREQESALSDIFAFGNVGLNVSADGQADVATGQAVSGNYFAGLGVQPLLGRVLTEEDDKAGASAAAVLSFRYWKQRFGGNPSVIGKQINLNNVAFTIIGVTPPGFEGTMQAGSTQDVTIPIAWEPQVYVDRERSNMNGAGVWWLRLMGRLKPGATAEQARAQLEGAFHQSVIEHRTARQTQARASGGTAVKDLDPQQYPRLFLDPGGQGEMNSRQYYAPSLYMLLGVVGLVLLIACANVANLLLSRAAARQKEIAIRLALGASRWRLIRQLLTESVLLAGLGGVTGILFALWIKDGVLAVNDWGGRGMRALEPRLDWRVLGFTVALSLVTGIVFGPFANKYFPDENPVGKRFTFDWSKPDEVEIVGLAQDAKYTRQRDEIPPTAYASWRQELRSMSGSTFEVRTAGDPSAVVPAVRLAVAEVDANLPLNSVKTQVEQADETLRMERLFARLLTLFGLLAQQLAAIGLFGVMAYAVSQRTREIGIRMALGADRNEVLKMILRQGMTLALLGVVLGLAGAYVLTRYLESQMDLKSMLYGVKASDPLTYGVIAAGLTLVALVACYIPARRATKVDPMVALRYE